MGSVPDLLKQRWASRNLVGDAAHSCLLRIRPGYMNRLYQPATMLDTTPGPNPQRFPTIWKGHNAQPWQGQWVPTDDWITLTNIQSANWQRGFSNSGGSSLTVVIDNVAFLEATGSAGVYHVITRGWYSPTRGVKVVTRPSLWASNQWDDVFNGGYQVELWEGYGAGADVIPVEDGSSHWTAPSASKTWVGLIEHCDMESHPDHITITCTDFAVMLTDQRTMGQNKATEIQSPITFADRRKVLGEVPVFAAPQVSSGSVSVDDDRLGVIWTSAGNSSPSGTEWVQIRMPAGFYRDFYVALPYDGETMYVSLYVPAEAVMDGVNFISPGWVDVGLGNVPGTPIPYIVRHRNTVSDPSRRWSLGGHTFQVPADTVLRLSFTNLSNDIVQPPEVGVATGSSYRAGVNSFKTFRFGHDPLHPIGGQKSIVTHGAKGWILVDDVADIVRIVLLWAGFHEMDVQDFGWSIESPLQFGQDAFLIDIVNEVLAQGNYCFFIDAPTDHDLSVGVPVLRPQSATKPAPEGMLQVRDNQMTEALQVTWDMSNLPYVLRFRGAVNAHGTTLFADTVKRWTGTYWPPWSGHDYTNLQGRNFRGGYPVGRVAGVRRQFSQTDPGLGSVAECLFACILTTVQYALAAVTGSFQTAGLPSITLDQQISLTDEGTGTNTRMWVASVDSQHTLGPSGAWHMTVGGSILDTDDMDMIAKDYKYTYQRYLVYKGGQ